MNRAVFQRVEKVRVSENTNTNDLRFVFSRYRKSGEEQFWTGDGWTTDINAAFVWGDATSVLTDSIEISKGVGEEWFRQPWPVRSRDRRIDRSEYPLAQGDPEGFVKA
jgi:hypothetical protein